MSKRSSLIIFTNSFPYGQNEQYLAEELNFLAASFRSIRLCPMSGEGIQRVLPSNVQVEKPLWSNKPERLMFYLRQVGKLDYWKLAITECIRAYRRNPEFNITYLYRIFSWAAYRIALSNSAIVNKTISDPAEYVSYSYWGHVPSLVVPRLGAAGVPCVVRFHSVDLYKYAMSDAGWLHQYSHHFPWREEIEQFSRVSIFVSEEGKKYFSENWPNAQSSEKVVSYLGVPAHPANFVRKRPEELTIVSCSHFAAAKRLELIARLVLLLGTSRRVTWHHFGSAINNSLLLELADKSDSTTIVFHGATPHEEIMKFYSENAITVFINLSSREGLSVAALEAMSYGIPVLATHVGGMSEAVIPRKSGALIGRDEAENPKLVLKKLVEEVLDIEDEFDPVSVWKEKFNSVKINKKLSEHLRSL